jgi:hypothetical protein
VSRHRCRVHEIIRQKLDLTTTSRVAPDIGAERIGSAS